MRTFLVFHTWKKPYKWSNQSVIRPIVSTKVYPRPQTIRKRMVFSSHHFSEIYWTPNLPKAQKNHACWLKMKFCFSYFSMTSRLCQKRSRPMKDFEIWWILSSRSKILEFWVPGYVCIPNWVPFDSGKFLESKGETLELLERCQCETSWRARHPNDPSGSSPSFGLRRRILEYRKKPDQRQEALRYKAKHAQQAQGYSLLPEQDQMFPMLHQFFSNPARRHWTLARRVLNYIKSTQD